MKYQVQDQVEGLNFGVKMRIVLADSIESSRYLTVATAATKREALKLARSFERAYREERRDAAV